MGGRFIARSHFVSIQAIKARNYHKMTPKNCTLKIHHVLLYAAAPRVVVVLMVDNTYL